MKTGLAPKQLRGLFVVIEVNVLLWGGGVSVWEPGEEQHVKFYATAGYGHCRIASALGILQSL